MGIPFFIGIADDFGVVREGWNGYWLLKPLSGSPEGEDL
jgi:hypothetical protein